MLPNTDTGLLHETGRYRTLREAFRDIFITAVVNRPRISDVYKLNYLRSHFKGVVWKKLTHRYENKKKVSACPYLFNFSIKPISDCNSKELKKILDSSNTPSS